ncbi:RHS repeat-associated core domain-containing protein [Chitinivorax sp. PXF-14]|uniref:RHS repeat domain-containing protein n=1 Tax=Chitinivorax sp. PXF-14 TaxID=3230488 RepID=UPI0034659F39
MNAPLTAAYRGSAYSRVKRCVSATGCSSYTVYLNPRLDLGATYERDVNGDSEKTNAYVYAAGQVIGSFESQNGMAHMRYFHRDNLGSIAVITDNAASVVERLSYDAWGKRRQLNGSDDSSNSIKGIVTHRGFTGQEHLENQGLVRMNGRVQDPWLGIFLSPDPVIGSPDNPQNYNRYGYVQNNPLTLTDPSGFIAQSSTLDQRITDAMSNRERFLSGVADQSAMQAQKQLMIATTTGDQIGVAMNGNQGLPQGSGVDTLFDLPRGPPSGTQYVWDQQKYAMLPFLYWGAATLLDIAVACSTRVPCVDIIEGVVGAATGTPSPGNLVGSAPGRAAAGAKAVSNEIEAAKGVSTGAESVANGLRLNKSLASEQQAAELLSGGGVNVAGNGTRTVLRDAPRLAAEYGGQASDWAKISSGSYRAVDGLQFEIHAYKNVATGQVVELKSIPMVTP